MAKIKTISLTRYVTRLLLLAFSSVIAILLLALFSFQVLISNGKIAPANAGETEARKEINRLNESQTFPAKLEPEFYNYIYFTEAGKVKETSLSNEELRQTISQYKDRNERYSTGTYVSFSDDSYALLTWRYKAQFVNQRLRKMFPNFEVLYFIGIGVALIVFFILFARRASKRLKEKLILVENASQQIAQKDLDSTIDTAAGIQEFDDVLHSMEEMRGALKESLVQQWEAQQQRKQEIAALTHDINTPLTVINGNAELLLEEELDAEQQQLIQHIYDSGLKTKQYIDLLQQISNFDVVQEEKISLSLIEVTDEMSMTLSPLAKRKGIVLEIQAEEAPSMIVAAPIMLLRALVNIGENAIRYTESGEVRVKVQRSAREIAFIFEDNGPGFSSEALTHAKEMFWQQDQSRTAVDNYGIGLSIVERVARYHNGQLKLENTKVGGKVTLTISTDE